MILAISCCHVPGISWSRAMRPHPIWPIFILLLGAFFPKTDEGTIVGTAMLSAAVLIALFKNYPTKKLSKV